MSSGEYRIGTAPRLNEKPDCGKAHLKLLAAGRRGHVGQPRHMNTASERAPTHISALRTQIVNP